MKSLKKYNFPSCAEELRTAEQWNDVNCVYISTSNSSFLSLIDFRIDLSSIKRAKIAFKRPKPQERAQELAIWLPKCFCGL